MVDLVEKMVFVSVNRDMLVQDVPNVSIRLKIIIKKMSNFIIDQGCNAGGRASCQNGGNCRSNGYCECRVGFSGDSCSTRNFFK